MKKLFFFSCMATLLLAGCATEFDIVSDDVPPAVTSAFNAKYSGAQNVGWEVEKSDGHLVFEAEFKMNGKSKEAEFKMDGTFVREE